ncbi:MAG: enoyl-CoA hydratase/isomerase family protein [Chloroflexota bacterium]|nr:enoyl-CoA hydratase/isomerase family protein [Chloroflexota bacterium]
MTERGDLVLRETRGRVGLLTLNRPEARNGLNSALLTQLDAGLRDMAADPSVGTIVLAANGPSFCAGGDLKEAATETEFWTQYERAGQSMRVHELLPRLPKPVIAAVDGHAVAGGCALAMSCDIVIASERAKFGYPEVGRGLVAAMAMVTLSRVVGRRQALDLLFSARIVGAEEALRLGMINRVVPQERLMDEVFAYAADMAGKSAAALRITKDLYRQIAEIDYDRALHYARDVNQMVRATKDARQGAADFAKGKDRT